MALLKEEGSLDIDKYESLPLEEWMVEMGKLTHEQVMEYLSKVPLQESNGPTEPIIFDPAFEAGVDADVLIAELRKTYEKEGDGQA